MGYFTFYASAVGMFTLCSDGSNLTALYPYSPSSPPEGHLQDDLPVSPAGTDFQRQVWQILLRVPYGKTVTYGQIARMLSDTMSAQAVGGAVGRNPICIVIPCHRCIGANRQLTGYAWGLNLKKWLLCHEEAITCM